MKLPQERQLRISASVLDNENPTLDLIDAAIPRYRKGGYPDQFIFTSEELATPRGLPLKFHVSINIKDQVRIESADKTILLCLRPQDGFYCELLLPTDELLRVSIDEQRQY